MVRRLSCGVMLTRVREVRRLRGLSREQLAVRAGVSSRTIEYIEQGRDARVSTALALARVLEVSLNDLVAPGAAS